MGVIFTLLVILFLVVSVALVLIILVQRPQGGGLAQAFGGGGGGTDTAFGGRTGDALTYALGAGKLFNVDERSEYVETLLAKARAKLG